MIDLHVHTTNSDGKLTEIETLKKAQKIGLRAISITDHNTCNAYDKLKGVNLSDLYQGELIRGCEFNTIVDNVPIELLGYDIDTDYIQARIGEYYLPFRESNIYETNLLIQRCLDLGLKLNVDDIQYDEKTEYGNRGVHREIVKHIENKKFLTEKSWNDPHHFSVNHIGNPKSRFFIDTSNLIPDYKEVVKFIRDSGGKVFIPHVFKYRDKSMEVLNKLLDEHCLDGIECYHSTYSVQQHLYLADLCKKLGLYISGGTDTHGTPDIELGIGNGNMNIPDNILDTWHKIKKEKEEKENLENER